MAMAAPAKVAESEIAGLIREIKRHKLEPIQATLADGKSCPAGAAFVGGQAIGPFPRLPYVEMPADAGDVAWSAQKWAIYLAVAYAHVRKGLPNQW